MNIIIKKNKISKKCYKAIFKNINCLVKDYPNKFFKLNKDIIINIDNIIDIQDNFTIGDSSSVIFNDNSTYTSAKEEFDILKPILRNKKLNELLKIITNQVE